MATTTTARGWDTFDVVKAILALCGSEEIPCSIPTLHEAIYRLAQKPEFADFFSDYVFEQRSYFPFSSELQTDLVTLEMTDRLSCRNPDFVRYQVLPKLRETFEGYTKGLFLSAELELLNRMAKEFCASVSTR